MRRAMIALAVITLFAISGFALPVFAGRGNGAPSGPHYNLNLIGKNWEHSEGTVLVNDGHRIFVRLGSATSKLQTKILLSEGDFAVLDADGTDGTARFQLPANPYTCPTDDPNCLNTDPTFQEYTVWIRPVGKPGGKATMTTCAVDEYGTEWCSTENVVLIRTTGKSTFKDVTKELTTVCVDNDADAQCDIRVGIFNEAYEGYLWNYDNEGLKVAQLRFYPIED